MKKNKGITLVALVVTIIVLIILAGVSINLVLGKNGIMTKAKTGAEQYKEAEVKQEIELAILEIETELASSKAEEKLSKEKLIEMLPSKLPEIIINYDLTGEYKSYQYKINEAYEVQINRKQEIQRTYLIKDGELKIEGTLKNATMKKVENYQKLTIDSTINRGMYYVLQDVSDYKKIKMDVEIVEKGVATSGCSVKGFMSYANSDPYTTNVYMNAKYYTTILENADTSKARDIYTINVEDLTGSYYIVLGKNATNPATNAIVHIYNIWLEK